MNETALELRGAFGGIRPYDGAAVERACHSAAQTLDAKIVVLDDDPTGVQTVHGVSVYTNWSAGVFRQAFACPDRMFFILTNSRGLDAAQTQALHRQIGENLSAAAREAGKDFLLVSRSDSTLRGHYPLETETLRESIEARLPIRFDGELLMPFFPEGGRYTMGGVHYVASGSGLIPVGRTEFARDRTFGFRSSSLPEWIEEKTGGRCRAGAVRCIGLGLLRNLQYQEIAGELCALRDFQKAVVDAVDYDDVRVFVTALAMARRAGRHFIFRTAAAFPKILGGIGDRPLLTRAELAGEQARGGLVIVGSHVSRTTEQLARLLERKGLCALEFNQHLIADPAALEMETVRVVRAAERALAGGRTAVVYTRRERIDAGGGREDELRLAVRISDAVTDIVRRLRVRPAWIVAKGGITSSEIGVKGLGVRRALVIGQAMAGVPVWRTGEESRFPGLSYVIFPGNVGDPDALRRLVDELCG